MAEQEILPCPNAECRGRCVIRMGTWARVECTLACGYHGPYARTHRADDAEAIRLHNAMPREEPWIEVAKAGLPEPSEQLWDIRILLLRAASPSDGVHWTEDGARSAFVLACQRDDYGWRAGVAGISVNVTDDDRRSRRVTHYRIHRAPKGPR